MKYKLWIAVVFVGYVIAETTKGLWKKLKTIGGWYIFLCCITNPVIMAAILIFEKDLTTKERRFCKRCFIVSSIITVAGIVIWEVVT